MLMMRKSLSTHPLRSFTSLIQAEKSAVFNCNKETLFSIVDDAPNYPKFVPWCSKSVIVDQKPDHYLVELEVGYKYFKDSYISQVYPYPHDKITTSAKNTEIFHHLESVWTFEAISDTQSKATQQIKFEFRNSLYQSVSGMVLSLLVDNIMKGFQMRANEITRIENVLGSGHEGSRGQTTSGQSKAAQTILRSPVDFAPSLEEDHNTDIIQERNYQTLRVLKGNNQIWTLIDAKIASLLESGILNPKEMAKLTKMKELAVFRKKVEDIYRLYIIQVKNETMFAMHLKDLCVQK